MLQATPLAEAVIAAIREENDDVTVRDEGAYFRILVPRVCRLPRATIEAMIGRGVQFPGVLEAIMSSFAGLLRLTERGAVWWLAGEAPTGMLEDE